MAGDNLICMRFGEMVLEYSIRDNLFIVMFEIFTKLDRNLGLAGIIDREFTCNLQNGSTGVVEHLS